jgi:hypothetical protein
MNILADIEENRLETLERISTINETLSHVGFTAFDAKIDSQVLIQLLIKKGIITGQEVKEMREVVKKNTAYGGAYDTFAKLIVDLDDKRKTVDALKRLDKYGKDALTQEELDRVSDSLNKIINGGNQYNEEE